MSAMTDPANFLFLLALLLVWCGFFFIFARTHTTTESGTFPSDGCVRGKATEMSGIFTLERNDRKRQVCSKTSQWANSRVAE
jgi:hypothetical protein